MKTSDANYRDVAVWNEAIEAADMAAKKIGDDRSCRAVREAIRALKKPMPPMGQKKLAPLATSPPRTAK
jgi:hypothetical protein